MLNKRWIFILAVIFTIIVCFISFYCAIKKVINPTVMFICGFAMILCTIVFATYKK